MDAFLVITLIGMAIGAVSHLTNSTNARLKADANKALNELTAYKQQVEESGIGNVGEIKSILEKYDGKIAEVSNKLDKEELWEATEAENNANRTKEELQQRVQAVRDKMYESNTRRVAKERKTDPLFSSSSITGKETD